MEREASGRGKAIKRPSTAAILRRSEVVLTLVEEDAGLLSVEQVGTEGEAVHAELDGARNFAQEDRGLEWKVFLGSDCRVVAGHDAFRAEEVFETPCKVRFDRV